MLISYTSFSFYGVSFITLAVNSYFFIAYLFKYRKNNFLCAEFFFSLSFIFCTYSYFFYQNTDSFSVQISLNQINDAYIVRGIIISTLCFLTFILGCCLASRRKTGSGFRTVLMSNNYSSKIKVIQIIYLFFLFLFILFDMPYYIHNRGAAEDYSSQWLIWLKLSQNLYTVVVMLNCSSQGVDSFHSFYTKNKFFCFSFLFISIILLLSGARHIFTTIALPAILLYSLYVKRLNNNLFIVGVLIMWGLFVFIRYARANIVQDFELNSTSIIEDFLPASLATPWLIQYADTYGYTYGTNYVLSILSIVPFLAGFIAKSGFSPALSSGKLYTISIYGDDYSSGLGTSFTGDLYYSLGFFGVTIFPLLFGFVVSKVFNKISNNHHSPYNVIVYTCIMSESLFLPRASWTMIIRSIALTCIFYFILDGFLSNQVVNKVHRVYSDTEKENQTA